MTSPLRRNRRTTRRSSKRLTAVSPWAAACAVGLAWSVGILEGSAGEWRRAGSAAAATAVATAPPIQPASAVAANGGNADGVKLAVATLDMQAPGAVRPVVHQVVAVRQAARTVAPVQGEEFDPFDAPMSDADVAMPRTDGPATGASDAPGIVLPGGGADKNDEKAGDDGFDPFEAPVVPPAQEESVETPATTAEESAASAAEPAEPAPLVGPLTAPDLPEVEAAPEPQPAVTIDAPVPARRPAETYDVQQMFDEPRGTRVGPSVQGGVDRRGQDGREELPRGGRSPRLPDVEGRGPTSPTDAVDSPIGRRDGGVEETFPGPTTPAKARTRAISNRSISRAPADISSARSTRSR